MQDCVETKATQEENTYNEEAWHCIRVRVRVTVTVRVRARVRVRVGWRHGTSQNREYPGRSTSGLLLY